MSESESQAMHRLLGDKDGVSGVGREVGRRLITGATVFNSFSWFLRKGKKFAIYQ